MKWIAKYRHIITVVIVIFCIGGLIYLGVRMQNLENGNVEADTFSGMAMGTVVKKTIYSESTAESEKMNQAIDDCLKELENQISVRVADSEISKCNSNYAVNRIYELSGSMIDYLNQEMQIYEETNGAFSPCIRPIADLWGIEDGKTEIPEADRVKDTLQRTDAGNIELVENGIIFHDTDMAVDFGAAGKGIACDSVMAELASARIQGAVIAIGGSIALYGDKGDGTKWHIGIQNPRGEDGDILGVVDLNGNKMVSTSGDYEKYFEADGRRYHHIFDPATGYPADSGLISVTIISDSGFFSDALSTACFVMGLDDGMVYAEEKGVDAIFVTADKEIYVTKGIKNDFHIKAEGYELK